MIKFKKKQFTIPEGSYTGSKDIESIPGTLSTVLKGTAVGAGIGAITGAILKDSSVIDGAATGAKFGTIGGIAAKLLLNYVHKPMSTIKYQEVDKDIRRQFGIYRMAGVTVGDDLDKRASLSDKFSFNDREVDKYKLIFAIHNNQVTMYTFGMTKQELDKTSEILDYYCKKYFAMEYSAKIINQRVNSYSVNITFTNYQVICNFIMELSNTLNTKIDLLDNNSIVGPRLENKEEKSFSVSEFNKYDIIKLVTGGITKSIGGFMKGGVSGIISSVQYMILDGISKMNNTEAQKAGVIMNRGSYNNIFLEEELNKLHYIDGFHYTTGDEGYLNMSIISGIFVISTTKEIAGKIEAAIKPWKAKFKKSNINNVVVFTYSLNDLGEFKNILAKIMKCGEKPNIFEKKLKKKLFSRNKAMVDKIVEKLDNEGICDYEVSNKIPNDVISITAELGSLKIYIPTDMDYAQYEIEDYIRLLSRFVRTQVTTERGLYVMSLGSPLNFIQYYKLIKNIIDKEGFCTILNI